jgi:hypothetical protein
MAAGEQRVEVVPAAPMGHPRRQVEARTPAVLPFPHAERDRIEPETFFGEPVFQPPGDRAVGQTLQHAMLDQFSEPCGQGAAGGTCASSQVLEAPHAQERIAQDQERPPVAHHLEHTRALAAPQQAADALDVPCRRLARHVSDQSSKRRGADR